jgi:integrase
MMAEPFREKNAAGKVLQKYRGFVRTGLAAGDRRKVTLFSDLSVSRRELNRLQSEADAAVQDPESERRRLHAGRPLSEHVADYFAFLRRTTKSVAHHRIAESTLNRLVALAGWQRLADISLESAETAVAGLVLKDGGTPTVAYRNGFVKRGKAFAKWLTPDRLTVNPLSRLQRGSTVRAEKRRARRAGTDAEVVVLVDQIGESRRLPLLLTLLAGLRRSEAASLKWGDVDVVSAVPVIRCRPEWTKNGNADVIPLHPVLVAHLLAAGVGPSGASVVGSVPDVKTIRRALERGGQEFVNVRGERLDHHALRHTFVTNLSRTGCTRPTRKALARHSGGDVTDGYDHTIVAEMYAAVCRLPAPFAAVRSVGAPVGQPGCFSVLSGASSCAIVCCGPVAVISSKTPVNQGSNAFLLPKKGLLATVSFSRPSTQVD